MLLPRKAECLPPVLLVASLIGTWVTVSSMSLCSLFHILPLVLTFSLIPRASGHNNNSFHFLSLLCWAKRWCSTAQNNPPCCPFQAGLLRCSPRRAVQKPEVCQQGSAGQFECIPLAQLWLRLWGWMWFKLLDLNRKSCLFWGLFTQLSNRPCIQTLSYCWCRCFPWYFSRCIFGS